MKNSRVKTSISKAFVGVLLGASLIVPLMPINAYANPSTIPVSSFPMGMAVNAKSNILYVADYYSNDVAVIDGTTNTVVKKIATGSATRDIGFNPNTNTIYAINAKSNSVSVIDGATNTVVKTIGVGSSPFAVAVNSSTNMIYVSNMNSSSVSVIDGATNTVVKTIGVGSSPREITVNPITNTVYVANMNSGTISVIDGTKNAYKTTIYLGYGSYPYGISVNPNTNEIYASGNGSTIFVVDGSTNAVLKKFFAGGYGPDRIIINPDTNTIYTADNDSRQISVINGATNTVSSTLYTGCNYFDIALNPTTNTLYVSNWLSNSIAVITLAPPTNTAVTTATNDMNNVKTLANNLSTANPLTQDTINSVQVALTKAISEVTALPNGTDKTNLQNEIQTVQGEIAVAQATLDMNIAQTQAKALSTANPLTQEVITSAQTTLTKANSEISALATSVAKTNLQTKGQAVQETINEAQATLDMNSAKTLGDELSGNLSQNAITTAQTALDKANTEVSALAEGTVKANLQAEAPAIQETINVAQATLDTQNAETSISQNDVNTAQTTIAKLTDGDIKTALETRITTVQDVINATNATIDTEASLATLNTTLATENLSPNGQPQQDALVSQLQDSLSTLQQQSSKTSDVVTSIPSTAVPTLTARITDLSNRLSVVNGYEKSIQQVTNELQSNSNKANGTLKDTTVSVKLNSTTDLASQFASVLTTQLGTASNLKWVSIDNNLGTVDANGAFTASHNGVAKVTAYNDKGIVDIIVKISNGTNK